MEKPANRRGCFNLDCDELLMRYAKDIRSTVQYKSAEVFSKHLSFNIIEPGGIYLECECLRLHIEPDQNVIFDVFFFHPNPQLSLRYAPE